MGPESVRTIVAESTALIRTGLVACLEEHDDIEVVADVKQGDHVLPVARFLQPQVAIIAASLPGQDGFTTARALHDALPSCRSLILSNRRSPGDVRRAAAACAAGVVVSDAAPEVLADAVRRVARGTKVVDPDLAFAALTTADNPLTPRELDTLRCAAQGATCAEIAQEMYLSVGTVRNYLSRVIAKTGARNRIDAIRIAQGSGWI
jgi:two-component system response regulator DesR